MGKVLLIFNRLMNKQKIQSNNLNKVLSLVIVCLVSGWVTKGPHIDILEEEEQEGELGGRGRRRRNRRRGT